MPSSSNLIHLASINVLIASSKLHPFITSTPLVEFANLTWAIYVPRLVIGSSEKLVSWKLLRERYLGCLRKVTVSSDRSVSEEKGLRLSILTATFELFKIARKITVHLVRGELTTSSTEIAFLFLRKLITKSTGRMCSRYFGCHFFHEPHNFHASRN